MLTYTDKPLLQSPIGSRNSTTMTMATAPSPSMLHKVTQVLQTIMSYDDKSGDHSVPSSPLRIRGVVDPTNSVHDVSPLPSLLTNDATVEEPPIKLDDPVLDQSSTKLNTPNRNANSVQQPVTTGHRRGKSDEIAGACSDTTLSSSSSTTSLLSTGAATDAQIRGKEDDLIDMPHRNAAIGNSSPNTKKRRMRFFMLGSGAKE